MLSVLLGWGENGNMHPALEQNTTITTATTKGLLGEEDRVFCLGHLGKKRTEVFWSRSLALQDRKSVV